MLGCGSMSKVSGNLHISPQVIGHSGNSGAKRTEKACV